MTLEERVEMLEGKLSWTRRVLACVLGAVLVVALAWIVVGRATPSMAQDGVEGVPRAGGKPISLAVIKPTDGEAGDLYFFVLRDDGTVAQVLDGTRIDYADRKVDWPKPKP